MLASPLGTATRTPLATAGDVADLGDRERGCSTNCAKGRPPTRICDRSVGFSLDPCGISVADVFSHVILPS
jgi:hypothetical protein